jgi:ABC-type amino acid transport substrate-binding protein
LALREVYMHWSARRRQVLTTMTALAVAGPRALAQDRALRIETSILPPFTIDNGATPRGSLYELVVEVMRRAGMRGRIEVLPWARAVFQTTHAARTAVFPLSRTEGREHQFRWLVKLYDEQYIFLVRKGGPFDARDPMRMTAHPVVLLRGSSFHDELAKRGFQNLVDANSTAECTRYLVNGLAEAVFGERAIVGWSLRNRPDRDRFDVSAPLLTSSSWLAGSADIPEADALVLQHAMEAMIADGTYARILRRYDLRPSA